MDPWVGEEINETQLNGQLETLVGECGCLQSAGALGVDLPLIWTEERDLAMVPLREPIEEDPNVLAGIRGSRMLSGPLFLLALLFGCITAGGAGLYILRARRRLTPLVTQTE
jgi:hypothetical protein